MRFVFSPVNMVGTGWVGSAATDLYLGAPRERRFCLPQTRFLIHQPSGDTGGPANDSVIKDIERDLWMPAEEAISYGLVSHIIQRRDELAPT